MRKRRTSRRPVATRGAAKSWLRAAASGTSRRTPARVATRLSAAPLRARTVQIANRHPALKLHRRGVEAVIHLLDEHHAHVAGPASRTFPGELSLVFLTDRALAALHGDFLDDPSTTDVITFEGDAAHGIGGEICVSADTAAAYAAEHGREFAEELTLYVVHGWLHLAGHDDLVPARKRIMRRAEARAMALLQKHRAVPEMELRPRRCR